MKVVKFVLSQLISLACLCLFVILWNACGGNKITASADIPSGTFTDNRDGQIYSWVILKDGKKWMSKNLNYETPDSWCYNEASNNCEEHGRIYTWAAAHKACPKGWHLPTDDEWFNMSKHYGKVADASKNKLTFKGGQTAYHKLVGSEKGKFVSSFSGNRTNKGAYLSLNEMATFWSDTPGSQKAMYYLFSTKYKKLSRFSMFKTYGMSCRCVED
ncbi:MAG: FISUMP domain-containing protein [Saprospiraceae bacterium]